MMLLKSRSEELRGILHIASAERINPFQFAERLAEMANLNQPEFPDQTILEGPVTGFGKGETTLDCSLSTKLLGVRMPQIDDGIGQFIQLMGQEPLPGLVRIGFNGGHGAKEELLLFFIQIVTIRYQGR